MPYTCLICTYAIYMPNMHICHTYKNKMSSTIKKNQRGLLSVVSVSQSYHATCACIHTVLGVVQTQIVCVCMHTCTCVCMYRNTYIHVCM